MGKLGHPRTPELKGSLTMTDRLCGEAVVQCACIDCMSQPAQVLILSDCLTVVLLSSELPVGRQYHHAWGQLRRISSHLCTQTGAVIYQRVVRNLLKYVHSLTQRLCACSRKHHFDCAAPQQFQQSLGSGLQSITGARRSATRLSARPLSPMLPTILCTTPSCTQCQESAPAVLSRGWRTEQAPRDGSTNSRGVLQSRSRQGQVGCMEACLCRVKATCCTQHRAAQANRSSEVASSGMQISVGRACTMWACWCKTSTSPANSTRASLVGAALRVITSRLAVLRIREVPPCTPP